MHIVTKSPSSAQKSQAEKHLQIKLQNYLKNLPFFQAVDLFETQNNLALCYELFMECALVGNAYALFYIKHLQDNFPSEINKKDNVIVNHLEYFLKNIPNFDNVDPKYWLDVSLIKQEYKHKLITNKKEQKDILNKLFDLAGYCSAGYIFLQDIIYNNEAQNINITEPEQQKWIKKLKSIESKVIDLFMVAYIKNDDQCNNNALIGTYFISDLNSIIKLIEQNGLDVYRLHGQLEREIANLAYYGPSTRTSDKGLSHSIKKQDDQARGKLKWQRSGALAGNDQLYMMFSQSTKLNEETKMKSALFAALAGNLICKSNLSQVSLKAGNQQAPAEMINPQLAEEWLLSFGELTIEQAVLSVKKNTLTEATAATAAKIVSDTYVNCGKLLEDYSKKVTEHQLSKQYLEKAFSCYLKAAKLGNAVGFFNAGIFYQYKMLGNSSDGETNTKLAIAMYSRAFDLNYQSAINKLIALHYDIENYQEIYKYINDLVSKNISIISFQDKTPKIYAEMLYYGLGGFAIDKDLAYRIIIDSANLGNKYSKLVIIRDFIDKEHFSEKLPTSKKLLKIGLDLYACYKSSSEDQFIRNSAFFLVKFFSHQEFVNQGGRDIALELIEHGLSNNYLCIKMIFAEFSLYGNRYLNIPQNGLIALNHLNELLTVGGEIVEANKPLIYNQIGIAYMRGVGLDFNYSLAEEYLRQAYLLKADSVEYNLSCLYYRMDRFTEAFIYLSEAFGIYPDDADILCDIATHYLAGLGVEEDFNLAKLYVSKSFKLNNQRAIPNYVIINILDMFSGQNAELTLQQCENLLSEYIASSALNLHNKKDKNLLYLLESGLALLNKPFEYPAVIQKLKSVDADYFVEFAIQYLENKPSNRDINYLGVDLLCIILLLDSCKNIAELKKAFNDNGLCLQLQQPKSLKSSQPSIDKNSNDFKINKIDKLKKELARFIHKDPKAKISFKDLKKLCFTSSTLFPDKTPCKISHATNGSGEKITLGKTDSHFAAVLSFHPEHRSRRSKEEKPDSNRRKAIKQFAATLQSRLIP